MSHFDRLYRYALVLTRNRAEAEDLVQETYVRAIVGINGLRNENSIVGWLLQILRNQWRSELRQHQVAGIRVDVDLLLSAQITVDSSADAHSHFVSKLERSLVQKAMLQLPSDLREILILREFEDLSYQEIASQQNCPIGTVMSRLARARSSFRLLLYVAQSPSISPHPQKATVDKQETLLEV